MRARAARQACHSSRAGDAKPSAADGLLRPLLLLLLLLLLLAVLLLLLWILLLCCCCIAQRGRSLRAPRRHCCLPGDLPARGPR